MEALERFESISSYQVPYKQGMKSELAVFICPDTGVSGHENKTTREQLAILLFPQRYCM